MATGAYLESYIDGQNTKRAVLIIDPHQVHASTHSLTPRKRLSGTLILARQGCVFLPKNSFFSTAEYSL